MKKHRLEALSDGIFAIVMTLLVIDLRVFDIPQSTDAQIWNMLWAQGPILLAYFLSFTLLFSYWRAHHFVLSVYASAIDVTFATYNMFFFMALGLLPFTSELLGKYHGSFVAVITYGVNVLVASTFLYLSRRHVFITKEIRAEGITEEQVRYSFLRTLVPIVFVVVACLVAFSNTNLAFALFVFAVFFNFSGRPTDAIYAWLEEKGKKGNSIPN